MRRSSSAVASLLEDVRTLANLSLREFVATPVLRLLPSRTFPRFRAAVYRAVGCRFEPGVSVIGTMLVIGPGGRAYRNIRAGEGAILSHSLVLVADAEITIGRHAVVSSWARLVTAYHNVGPAWRRMDPSPRARPIRIGDGCWIALGVTVLPGVTIGPGTVVGAGSVVTGDLPANVVAAGNPARVIRSLDVPPGCSE